MMRLKFFVILLIATGCCVGAPVFAQTKDSGFFDAIRLHLIDQASPSATSSASATGRNAAVHVPASGASEQAGNISVSPVLPGAYGAYDAGRDTTSGWLAAGAALLGILIVIFLFAFSLSAKHRQKTDGT